MVMTWWCNNITLSDYTNMIFSCQSLYYSYSCQEVIHSVRFSIWLRHILLMISFICLSLRQTENILRHLCTLRLICGQWNKLVVEAGHSPPWVTMGRGRGSSYKHQLKLKRENQGNASSLPSDSPSNHVQILCVYKHFHQAVLTMISYVNW